MVSWVRQGRRQAWLKSELCVKLGQGRKYMISGKKKELFHRESRAAVHIWREKRRKAKAQFEFAMDTMGLHKRKSLFQACE